nr:hypothetical protein [Angustibacter aerolatus]
MTVTGTAPLPAPVLLGVDRVAPPQTVEPGDPGDVEPRAVRPGHGRARLLRVARGHAGRRPRRPRRRPHQRLRRDHRRPGASGADRDLAPGRGRLLRVRPPEHLAHPGSTVRCSRRTCRPRTWVTPSPAPRQASSTTRSRTTSLLVTALPTVQDRHLRRETTQAAGRKEPVGRDVQRREPRAERPGHEVRAAGRPDRAQPGLARRPGAGGDPGRHRRDGRRHGHQRCHGEQAWWRRSPLPAARATTRGGSTRRTTPTAASRAATSARCCSSTRPAASRSSTGPAATPPPR